MPYCTSCGKPVDPEGKFCTNCGKPVENEEASSQESDVEVKQEETEHTEMEEPKAESGEGNITVNDAPPPKVAGTGSASNKVTILLSSFLALAVIGAGVLGFLYMDKSEQYTTTFEDLNQANQNISSLNGEVTDLNGQIDALDIQVSDLTSERDTLQANLDDTQADLDAVMDVYPPRHFENITELTAFINAHKSLVYGSNSDKHYMFQQFALEEGYLWSVNIWHDSNGYDYITSSVVVGNTLYYVSADGLYLATSFVI